MEDAAQIKPAVEHAIRQALNRLQQRIRKKHGTSIELCRTLGVGKNYLQRRFQKGTMDLGVLIRLLLAMNLSPRAFLGEILGEVELELETYSDDGDIYAELDLEDVELPDLYRVAMERGLKELSDVG